MPTADTAYLIGVIRDWEKGLLQADEYTRLIEADSPADAIHALVDTPYGQWIDPEHGAASALVALQSHLKELREWLAETLDEVRVYQFITGRYDALNIATALLEQQAGRAEPGALSPLGSVPSNVWQSVIWHNVGWDQVPELWEVFVRQMLEETPDTQEILRQVAQRLLLWLDHLAFTPLMHDVVAFNRTRQAADQAKRPWQSKNDASEYERQWDEKFLATVKQYRWAPIGYDPIMAFWYAKEMEVKGLRLLLSAKLSGLAADQVRQHQRPLFLSVR